MQAFYVIVFSLQKKLHTMNSWTMHHTAQGVCFYHNEATKVSVWELPEGAVISEIPQPSSPPLSTAIAVPESEIIDPWLVSENDGTGIYEDEPAENQVLQEEIDRLDHANFSLREDNTKLKCVIQGILLSERGYFEYLHHYNLLVP
jgi:hypothetical protein